MSPDDTKALVNPDTLKNIELVVGAVIIAIQSTLSGWHLRTNAKNRKGGEQKDKVSERQTKLMTDAIVGMQQTMREYGAKLAVILTSQHEQQRASSVLEARVANLEKTLERVQDDVAELRRRA